MTKLQAVATIYSIAQRHKVTTDRRSPEEAMKLCKAGQALGMTLGEMAEFMAMTGYADPKNNYNPFSKKIKRTW